ncbi:hypothetical protein M433DRAFT_226888 [Acidomyces richmondensis BFW]|nr:hypothetical protein M433DRAFT_226888 [Acidomyces richmondensis BFW]
MGTRRNMIWLGKEMERGCCKMVSRDKKEFGSMAKLSVDRIMNEFLNVRLVGHLKLVLVRYERGKLIYTHCHVITSHELGRCVVQTATAL